MRGHPLVSAECVARVRQAADRLGYNPLRDRTGRTRPEPLAGKRIAIVMFGIDRALAGLPVVAEAIHGAEEALAEAGAHPVLIDVPDPAEPPRALRRTMFDGIVAKAALEGRIVQTMTPKLRTALRTTPLIWLLGRPADAPGDAADPDDVLVGRLAATALLDHGHRRVAVVNPKADHAAFAARVAAFRQAVAEGQGTVTEHPAPSRRTVSFPLQPVIDVAHVQPIVDRIADSLRRRHVPPQERPTAIFCPADSIAALVYRALATRGLVPGREVSLVSCNHERALVAGLWPTLATVEVHPRRLGRLAVEQLARRITGQFAGAAVEIRVEPAFVPGGSLARVPAGGRRRPPRAPG